MLVFVGTCNRVFLQESYVCLKEEISGQILGFSLFKVSGSLMSVDIVEMFFFCVKVANTFYRKIVWCTAESKPNQKPLKEHLMRCCFCGKLAITFFCRRVLCTMESKPLTLQLHFTAEKCCGLRRGNLIKSHLKSIL